MTDLSLNDAARRALGWTARNWWLYDGLRPVMQETDWSPATKIEHAWLVQEKACEWNSVRFKEELELRNPTLDCSEWAKGFWLATAPPRARVEAGLSVLGGES